MSNVIYKKFGENRGKKRIWIQGERLSTQGITPGMTFIIHKTQGKVVMEFVENGTNTVSSKNERGRVVPVIDVEQKDLGEYLGNAERIRAVIYPDKIVVTVHHQEVAEEERLKRILTKLQNGESLHTGSLASGGGILDHAIDEGLKIAGVETHLKFAVEIDEDYLNCSQKNNPIWRSDSIAIEAPMQEVEVNKLPKIEWLNAGLPCTGASLSGRSKNKLSCAEEHDSAGALFVAFLRVVIATDPAVIVLENVPPYQTTASMIVIRSVLTELGYIVQEMILDGNEFGALEARKRLCMVATTKGLPIPNIANLKPLRQKESCINDILEHVPDDSERWKNLAYLNEKEARDISAGKGFRRQVLSGNEDHCGTIGKGYAKLRSTESFIRNPRTGLERIFTPTEHARVKTIPDYLIEGLSDTKAHEVLGQSIIHSAFVAVGKWVGDELATKKQQRLAA